MKVLKVAGTLIPKDGKFLLIKSKVGDAAGLWNNPGGHVEPGESFEECAIRETLEETGYEVKLGRVIGTYNFEFKGKRFTKVVFEAEIVGGELKLQEEEIGSARWFALEEIVDESKFTFGAIKSIQDFISNEFEKTYNPERIA